MSPSKSVSSNKYKYTISPTEITTLPALADDLSSWTTWNGVSDITATNGYYIAVAETESDYTCEKVGTAVIVSKEAEPETPTT